MTANKNQCDLSVSWENLVPKIDTVNGQDITFKHKRS